MYLSLPDVVERAGAENDAFSSLEISEVFVEDAAEGAEVARTGKPPDEYVELLEIYLERLYLEV